MTTQNTMFLLLSFALLINVSTSLLDHPYTTVAPMPSSYSLLVDDIIDLRHRLTATESAVTQLQTQLAQKDTQLQTLQNEFATVRQKLNGTPIAFSALLDHSLVTLHHDQSVAFNQVLTDTRSAYNTDSGHFTVPETGIYFFSWHTQTSGGHVLTTCLAVNGLCKLHAYANAGSEAGTDIQPDGNSGALSLNAGDVVWISIQNGESLYSNSGAKWFYPSFSGFKISQ